MSGLLRLTRAAFIDRSFESGTFPQRRFRELLLVASELRRLNRYISAAARMLGMHCKSVERHLSKHGLERRV
jgi:hypothetical protein